MTYPSALALNRSLMLLVAALGLLLAYTAPAPAQLYRPARIMALGDSLTSSIDGQASYRYWLWRQLAASGYWIDFVGSQRGVGTGAYTPRGFDPDHEGHPGATTDDILANIRGWAIQARPDIVVMLVGATDLEHGVDPAVVVGNSGRIISRLRAVNPNVKIVWAMLPPAADYMSSAKAYNGALLRVARSLSTYTSPVWVVNLWTESNPEADTVDGVHPNARGEKKYASRFRLALVPLLMQLRGY